MTSLHVICGLDPPIKNPGYAYALSSILLLITVAGVYCCTRKMLKKTETDKTIGFF